MRDPHPIGDLERLKWLGVIMPIAEVGEICRAKGIVFHVDAAQATGKVAIDLPAQTVTGPDGKSWHFDIHPLRKRCLVEGLDDFALTDRYADEFAAFEARYRAETPWLFGDR